MQTYSAADLSAALLAIGVARGDLIYLSTRLYGLGVMLGARGRDDFLSQVHASVRSVIGAEGTLVVPTFTQQVGRFGLPYVHEETASLTGVFGEFLRARPDGVRSLHPVFSVAAEGPLATAICDAVAPAAFGFDSAFDRMVRYGGRVVCMGFDYYTGHIVSLMHYVETSFAVPYYYNKIVRADVFAGGQKVERPFVINVKYPGLGCQFEYRRYIDALAARNAIRSAELGGGMIYSVTLADHMSVGYDLLKTDVYAFLDRPPAYTEGQIPFDGPPERMNEAGASASNWPGFYLGQ